MAADFVSGVAELVGTVPKLSALHAQQILNRAWGRIRDYRLWSFNLISDAQIWVPDAISAGHINTTNGSTAITTDATAGTALNAVAAATPPLAGVLGIGRQIRVTSASGVNSSNGPYYTILSWVYSAGIGTITIDKPYGEATASNALYQVLKVYYNAPNLPFVAGSSDRSLIKFISIVNRFNGYAFSGKNLNRSQEQLNTLDPQRGGQGDVYLQANYSRGAAGVPIFELYPNPVKSCVYNAVYLTRWPDLSPAQDLPVMPYSLSDCVIHLAKVYAAQWATANVATFQELGTVNWIAYMAAMKAEAKESLQLSIKMDDEILPWGMLTQGAGFIFPLGGAFIQGHDISSLFPSY
ncbi:MAG TPA: hypothetical protein VEL77_15250 [Rugosimonospora sp.]|nr:hypothetical protein [Rugosimonospora sp.]